MNIEEADVAEIVKEMSSIIQRSVNIMNKDGIIISSTDTSRIDTFHEGARTVIENELDELIIYDDNEYTGAKKGINLPIVLDGEIIGVIGIRGEYSEVIQYGKIIKKMTEILILEKYIQVKSRINTGLIRSFIKELLAVDTYCAPKDLIERGRLLDIDASIKRRVMIITISNINAHKETKEGYILIDNIEKLAIRTFSAYENALFLRLNDYILFMPKDCSNNSLSRLASSIIDQAKKLYDVNILVGIDQQHSTLKHAYSQAEKAVAIATAQKNIIFYEDLMLEIFLGYIPNNIKHEFINKLYSNFTKEEVQENINILRVYYETDCSITKTAEKLYIHKNTVQYKLKKIFDTTGYDPRVVKNAVVFYMSLYFYDNIR